MQWVLWMIAVAVLGLAAVAASGRLGELPGTVTDTPRPHVPTGVVTGDDLRGLRFAVVPRGYSMDQVDELLDRLARQLDGAGALPIDRIQPAEQTGAPEPAAASDPKAADGVTGAPTVSDAAVLPDPETTGGRPDPAPIPGPGGVTPEFIAAEPDPRRP